MTRLSRTLLSLVGIVGALASQADVLVSEGCDTASDYKDVTESGNSLLNTFPKSFTSSKGLKKTKWSGYGSTPLAYLKNAPLPDCFASAGLLSGGAACVGHNRGSNVADNRWGYLELDTGKLAIAAGETIYLRGLIVADKEATSALATPKTDAIGNGNCYSFGLSKRPTSYNQGGGTPLSAVNNVGFVYWRDSTTAINLSLRAVSGDSVAVSKRLISGLTPSTKDGVVADSTYICCAEIKVGAGTDGKEEIRGFVARVSEYDPANVTWSDPIEAEIISDTAYPDFLYFGGDYQSSGWAVYDEFVVGTEMSDVMVAGAAGAPKLTGATLTGNAVAYAVSATVENAAATDAGVMIEDGANEAIKKSAGAVEQDGNFEKDFTTEGLAADTTYQVSAYAVNAAAEDTKKVGSIYTGALTLTFAKNADEYNCVPGEVTVSRANADPYPLTVNYTFASTAAGAAEGTTWETPTPVTIPANQASTTIYLKPLVDSTVEEDITVTLSLTDGCYTLPTANAVDLTLKNIAFKEGYNTWIAAVNGSASVAANWSAGRVRFFDSILVHTLLIPLGTVLDLNGQNVISKRARIGGKLLGSGRYLATDFADSSCIVDSAETAGSLTIIGSGFTVRVR